MACKQLLILSVLVAAITAAPQFSIEDETPVPHDFAYGVEVSDTGDAKEHKQTVSPSGRTEGEYRWLQPNGLYTVVRYYVDGDSGFQAEVSEEPGPAVGNYYTNSLSQESSSGAASASSSQSFARSFDSQQSSLGRNVNVISAPGPPSAPP
ncbi:cuticular protein CPR76a [Penaeus vannamei]|uniref:Cuticular protein CPR76a n=1 Tax=Penaeus vannamei TaxID=6689 RepID=A0A423TKH1_PENVA|nr:cuticular protein CPR76a [Penaeus vannamei]